MVLLDDEATCCRRAVRDRLEARHVCNQVGARSLMDVAVEDLALQAQAWQRFPPARREAQPRLRGRAEDMRAGRRLERRLEHLGSVLMGIGVWVVGVTHQAAAGATRPLDTECFLPSGGRVTHGGARRLAAVALVDGDRWRRW